MSRPVPQTTAIGYAIVPCVLITLSLVGCTKVEEIRTYRVATAPAATPAPQGFGGAKPAAPVGEPTDRMLAAIVAGQDQVWFFKAVGPIEAISTRQTDLIGLLQSIDPQGPQPSWKLPPGWTEQPGNGMRLATLQGPAAEGLPPVEVSVIGLPKVGDWRAQVLDNLNRWRGQMGQPPLESATLDAQLKPLLADRKEAVLIDFVGWFAGGMMPGTPVQPSPPQQSQQAAPPADTPTPGNLSAAPELTFDTPLGWVVKPASAMRKASFTTAAGSEVTAFVFSAAAEAMADPLQNVNRWRSEVGLEPITAPELDQSSETYKLAGEDGTYVELVGATETTYAAMLRRGPSVWFFKLRGPGEAAASDREAFRTWLTSVRF
ncbi:hypothetical protein [Botrimarina hoheduenensis]|uniref:Uncharacterized protein n=1 Tax=Botrimarina hoheduenensis TaxID=2528000 RepID=A0A5C5VYX2_9BACT|nr:hypothetical protein [Botrimarina hoheduenensis]TWT42931.1 hypothetical protein Pla111_25690 [Botrimarina hoheduenensis]